jgi:hypothetical protein
MLLREEGCIVVAAIVLGVVLMRPLTHRLGTEAAGEVVGPEAQNLQGWVREDAKRQTVGCVYSYKRKYLGESCSQGKSRSQKACSARNAEHAYL